MFEDLSNSQLTYTNPNRTKASPSVYSDNDGSFNSEENLRWMTKKIAQKPFIVGKDTAEVNRSLETGEGPYGLYVSDGVFNTDGYLFKVSGSPNVSYDKPFGGISSFVANTIYVQKFVSDLVHYGDAYEIKSELPSFCFATFLPTPYGLVPVETARDNWKDAINNHKAVGFIRMVYSNDMDYKSKLIQSDQYFEFLNNGNTIGKAKIDQSLTDDANQNTILSDIFLGDNSNCYAVCKEINSDLFIYYPVYVEKLNSTNAIITFTDIFGIRFENAVQRFYTYTYPSTVSNLMDMDAVEQNPFADILGIDKTTFPTNHFMYNSLYDDGIRKTENSTHIIGQPYSSIQDVTKLSISDLSQYLPSSQTYITAIENNLSYYCIPDSVFTSQGTDLRIDRDGLKIPVAVFTSEGSLCTNGLILDNNTTAPEDSSKCIIESYIHFLKRNYLVSKGMSVTETAIQEVTVGQLSSWSDFTNMYNTYLSGPLSAYLNLCYDSLLSNVFYNDGSTDSQKIKAHGAGLYVSGSPSGDGGVRTAVPVQSKCYTVNNQTVTQVVKDKQIVLENDKTSDYCKVNRFIRNVNTDREKLLDDYELYIYGVGTITSDDTYQPLLFEDPIEFLRKCFVPSVSGLDYFDLKLPNNTVIRISDIDKKLKLDEFLVPKRHFESTVTSFNMDSAFTIMRTKDSIVSSIASSICYAFYKNTWAACIPTTITVNKDALSYLRGRDYDNANKYDGLTWNYKLPCDVSDDDLYIFDLKVSSVKANEPYDTEQSQRIAFYDSDYLRVRREAFIHTSKIYGDNYKGFEECVKEIADSIISEELGGYDISDLPVVSNALVDHINNGNKNQIQVLGNPDLDFTEGEYFQTNINSNVRFRYYRDRSVFPYRDYIEVSLNDGSQSANSDSSLSISFYCSGGNLCLTGCPIDTISGTQGSVSTYYAEIKSQSSSSSVLVDIGDYDPPVQGIVTPGNMNYIIHIKQGTIFSQTTDYKYVFEPMLCSYPAYTLTDERVAYTPTVYGMQDSIDNIDQDLKDCASAIVNLINRPDKNLLCRCSGKDSGYFTSNCSKPLTRNNYVIYIRDLRTNPTLSTKIELLDKNMTVLKTITNIQTNTGIPITLHISRTDPLWDGRYDDNQICFVRCGGGWNPQHTSPIDTIEISGMMLCLESEWEITDSYEVSIGNVTNNFKSLCDRSTKNKLFASNYPSDMIEFNQGYVEFKAEYTLPISDYVVYIKSLSSLVSNLTVCLVDSNDVESYKYTISNSDSDITLFFDEASLISIQGLQDVVSVRVATTGTSPTSEDIMFIKDIMLCTKDDWMISDKFIPSLSSKSYNAFLPVVQDLKKSLAKIIDGSSKNLYRGPEIVISPNLNDLYVEIDVSNISFEQSESYTILIDDFTSSGVDPDYTLIYADSTESDPMTFITHAPHFGVVSTFTATQTNISKIRIYTSSDHETLGAVTCNDIMICYKDFFDISDKFVKQSPTNAELYEMIQNL